MPEIVEDCLPLLPDGKGGFSIGIPTVRGIKYADGVTLAMALATMNEQIAKTAEMLATQTAALADITAWLTENLDYQPQPREPKPEYLTPLFAALTQVPPQTGSTTEEQA